MRGGKPHTKIKIFNSKEKKKMANITINTKNGTIELAKKFAEEARKYGTKAYKELQGARRDYPGYTVVTLKSKSNTNSNKYKGLDMGFMEMYINRKDKENDQKNIKIFRELQGYFEGGEIKLGEGKSFIEIRNWFLNTYPEIAKFLGVEDELKKNDEKISA